MPSATPNYAIPFPLSTDAPAGHTQMQSLATQVDTVLNKALARKVLQTGVATFGTVAGSSVVDTGVVTFPVPFVGAAPNIFIGVIESGTSSQLIVSVLNPTITSTRFRIRNTQAGPNSGGFIMWLAYGTVA